MSIQCVHTAPSLVWCRWAELGLPPKPRYKPPRLPNLAARKQTFRARKNTFFKKETVLKELSRRVSDVQMDNEDTATPTTLITISAPDSVEKRGKELRLLRTKAPGETPRRANVSRKCKSALPQKRCSSGCHARERSDGSTCRSFLRQAIALWVKQALDPWRQHMLSLQTEQ